MWCKPIALPLQPSSVNDRKAMEADEIILAQVPLLTFTNLYTIKEAQPILKDELRLVCPTLGQEGWLGIGVRGGGHNKSESTHWFGYVARKSWATAETKSAGEGPFLYTGRLAKSQ